MNAIHTIEATVQAVKGEELELCSENWTYPHYLRVNDLAGFSKPPVVGDRIVVFIGTFTGAIVHAKGIPVDR